MKGVVRSLAELLSMPPEEVEAELFGRSQQLASEVHTLPQELRGELVSRLEAAWPAEGFSSLVKRHDDRSFRIASAGLAWTSFAPELDEELEWLRRQWTPEASALAVTECNETDARTWGTLLQVTPGRLPDDFADALTERLSAVSEHDEFELDRIGSRFVEEDRVDALRALAAKNEALGTRLRPYLAALGDPIQVRTLLDGLKQSLSTGETADRLDLTWLNGAAQEEFLDELFECLVLARRFERNPFGASGMLESAIAQVGGMDAVAKYDEVIAKHPF